MKQRNPITRLTAGTLSLLLALPSTFALEGTILSQDTSQLIPGFTYESRTAETSNGQIQSYTISVSPDSTAFPIVLHGTGTIYGGGNINTALSTATERGYHIMGAINSDYFTLGSGVPMGLVIEDGVYKSSPSVFSNILFNGNDCTILPATTIPITVENQRSGQELTLTHFNKIRMETGGLYLYNRDYSDTTKTSTEGVMVRLYPTYEQLESPEGATMTVDSTLEFTVLEIVDSGYPLNIEENQYILTAADESGYREMLEDFQIGDRVTISTYTNSWELRDAQWATGGGDLMISQGQITDTSTWQHSSGLAPRSAFGVKEDGTLVFYAVDGRQDSSVGMTQLALAQHLLDEGCYYAVNLDGGGSTSLAVSSLTSPFTLSNATLVNSPSEGSLRSCGTFLYFADPRTPDKLALDNQINYVLLGSHINLGRVSVRDVNNTVLDLYPTDGTVEALNNLGILGSYVDNDGYAVYDYSPMETGTEIFAIDSDQWNLYGDVPLEIVDLFSSLGIALGESGSAIDHITIGSQEKVTFYPKGYVDSQEVYANGDSLQWSVYPVVEGGSDYGEFLSGGYFQVGTEDCIVQLQAGGLTARLYVEIETIFDDVPITHWAYEAIDYLASNNVIGGYSPTTFGMGAEISRGDFVLMLYRAFNSPEVNSSAVDLFLDVSEEDYAATAISWAVEQGIVAGMGDNLFGKEYPITREQAFLIIYRGYQAMNIQLPVTSLSTLSQYQDQHDISSYCLHAAASLTQQGILEDTGNFLYPKASLSREAMAYYIYNMLFFSLEEQIPPTSFSLHINDVSLKQGEKYTLLPLIEPYGAGTNISWTSSDPSAVTVNENGSITNVFTGTGQPVVTITATAGDFTARCVVRCISAETDYTLPSYKLPDISENFGDTATTPDTELAPEENLLPEDTVDPQADGETDSEDDTQSDTETEDTIDPNNIATTGFVIDAPGGLNLRKTPDSSGEILTQLPESTLVNLHSYLETGWYQISCYLPTESDSFTAVQGYVMSPYIQQQTILATVALEDVDVMLNLREGAGTAFDIIARLPNGSQVLILQSFGGWFKVQAMINGSLTTGFVANTYLHY